MHRIDHATRAVDLHGPGKDGFTGGDPVQGLAGTTVTADWLNAIQEEIANAVALGNVALAKGANNQLAQVIAALTADDPEAPPEQTPVVDRVSYVGLQDIRCVIAPDLGATYGWAINPDFELNARAAGIRARHAINIPTGAEVSFVEAAVFGPGVKLHLFRETYAANGASPASQGARVTDVVDQDGVWNVLNCTATALQNKATSRMIVELEASGNAVPLVGGYGLFRWLRIGWRGLATLPDTV